MTRAAKSSSKEIKPVIYTRDEHNISRRNIDEDALKIMYRLIRNGYKAFLVGGGVRDLLLGKKPKDFDIGTDATPRKIKSLFRNSRIIGRRFKLVHIYFRGNKNIEVSTFRAENEIGDELNTLKTDNVYGEESTDALRRDLTINGLFYDLATFSVIDYVGGMEDLKAGVIRVIGDPDVRFKDDPVRLLRVIRHAARNNFKVNKECWESLVRNRELIVKSSAVRVYEEFKKDFVSAHLLEILRLLAKSGLLDYLLPIVSEQHERLLAENSSFAKVIGSVDKAAAGGKNSLTATAVLSIIALALLEREQDVVKETFDEQVKEHVRNVFSSLSVPRREKEKIVNIILTLHELSTKDLKRVKLNSLSRRPYFKDLILIVGIMGEKYFGPEIHEILQAALKNVPKDKSEIEARRHQSSKTRGPRRRRIG